MLHAARKHFQTDPVVGTEKVLILGIFKRGVMAGGSGVDDAKQTPDVEGEQRTRVQEA